MENQILYVILNKELNMSAGKAAAQAVHAAMMLKETHFANNYKRTVVVLEAKNAAQLENLWEYLRNADIYSQYYIDEGANEVEAYSTTALAVEPIGIDDDEKREIFASFPLFNIKTYSYCAVESEPTNHMREAERYVGNIVHSQPSPRYVRKAYNWLKANR